MNDLKKKSLNNVGVSQKPKLQGENQIEDDDGKVPTPKSGGKLEDMKEETESPEATIKRMQERMSFFEKELRHSGILTKSDDGLSVDTSPIRHDKNGKAESKSKRQPAIPKLQYVEWEEFKHKYADDNKVYAVEVLTGEARYYYQKEEDLKNIKMGRSTTSKVQAEVAEKIEPPSTNLKSFKELPERIRINSEPILEILGQIDSEDEWRPYIMRKCKGRTFSGIHFYLFVLFFASCHRPVKNKISWPSLTFQKLKLTASFYRQSGPSALQTSGVLRATNSRSLRQVTE